MRPGTLRVGVRKQLLYTQVLREKIGEVLGPTEGLREAAAKLREQEDVFFSENFLVERPILQAITSETPPVLLLDEIDRADEEFEAFLLEFLSDYQVSIPEIGTVEAEHPPVVILTSNRTRELSEALKRRCLHLQIDYPSPEVELEIVRLKALASATRWPRTSKPTGDKGPRLRKSPSAGGRGWARRVVLGAPNIDKRPNRGDLSVIVKDAATREGAGARRRGRPDRRESRQRSHGENRTKRVRDAPPPHKHRTKLWTPNKNFVQCEVYQ